MTAPTEAMAPDLSAAAGPDPGATASRPRQWAPSPLLITGLVIVGVVVIVGVCGNLLTPYDPHVVSGGALQSPSVHHWLGTNSPGQDIFSQLVYGTRASLVAALLGGSLAMVGAILFGVVPTLRRGLADSAFNRATIFLLALPSLPLLVAVGALAGGNQLIPILVIALVGVAPNARILRSQALALRDRGFIGAARGFGGGPIYVLRRHVVPAMGPLVVIGFVNWAGIAVALQAALAFLGLGNASAVSWGAMMNRALSQQGIYLSPMWTWWVLPPGFAITVTLLGFTFIGVGLEPAFNPRWRRSS